MAGIWTRLRTNDNDLPDEDASLSVHLLKYAASMRAFGAASQQGVFNALNFDAAAQADWQALEAAYSAQSTDIERLAWLEKFEAVLGAYKHGFITEESAKALLGVS